MSGAEFLDGGGCRSAKNDCNASASLSSIALLIKLAACYLEAVMGFLTDSLDVSGWRTLPEALPTQLNRG